MNHAPREIATPHSRHRMLDARPDAGGEVDAATASHDKLFDYEQFPVCAPALATRRSRPLHALADLSGHVLIEFETLVYGRPWYDWQQWLAAMKLRNAEGAGWLRF